MRFLERRREHAESLLEGLAPQHRRLEWETKTFPVHYVRIEGDIALPVTIRPPAASGLQHRTLRAEVVERDRLVQGEPRWNVPEDPEDLPSEAWLRQELEASALGELGRMLAKAMGEAGRRRLESAKSELLEFALEAAVEELVALVYDPLSRPHLRREALSLLTEASGWGITDLP